MYAGTMPFLITLHLGSMEMDYVISHLIFVDCCHPSIMLFLESIPVGSVINFACSISLYVPVNNFQLCWDRSS